MSFKTACQFHFQQHHRHNGRGQLAVADDFVNTNGLQAKTFFYHGAGFGNVFLVGCRHEFSFKIKGFWLPGKGPTGAAQGLENIFRLLDQNGALTDQAVAAV